MRNLAAAQQDTFSAATLRESTADELAKNLSVPSETIAEKLQIKLDSSLPAEIQKNILDAIVSRETQKEKAKELSVQRSEAYINAQIVPHWKQINKLIPQNRHDRKHLIILSLTHIQQKMANYLHDHVLKYGDMQLMQQVKNYYMKKYKEIVDPQLGHLVEMKASAEQEFKWIVSHAVIYDVFFKAKGIKVQQLTKASIEALDMHHGVDFLAIDKPVYKAGKVHVPVYLVDAKSYIWKYGDDVHIERINRDIHQSLHSVFAQHVETLVSDKINKDNVVIHPVKFVVNAAYRLYLSDLASESAGEKVFTLKKNLSSKLKYIRDAFSIDEHGDIHRRRYTPTE